MDTTTIQGKKSSYHVLRALKSGGMGEVLLARDDMDRRVAIKRPFQSAMADGLARFELEARAAILDHPNIAKIYEAGVQPDGRPYLAMEFVDGRELKEVLESGEPMDLLLKLSIIEQVCQGLGYAHTMGFIHRDIKPGNVMIQGNGVAKIIDFGIAKMTDLERTTDLTQTSQVIGSLHYIAPERFKNEAMDGRADIFSAGVMLYLMLTGRLPFSGGEVTAAYQIVNDAPAPLREQIKDYPPALDSIMDQALAKNPEDRFPTAEDMADALHDVIEDVKKSRVLHLFDDAERLTVETRYDAALQLLDEAIKIDPSNTQVRKLRKIARDHQDRKKRAERLKEYVARADTFLSEEKYADALAQLKDAQRIDSSSTDLRNRIALVEEIKRRYERSVQAINEAEAAKNRGDITAALRISEAAVQEDPENTRLLALRAAIAKQLEREAQEAQLTSLFDAARRELGTRNFPEVERLLAEAEAVDHSHPQIEELRREAARVREQQERRQLIDEIQRRVNDFLRGDNYEQATDLLNRAIDKLPDEPVLHRLKLEVDTAAQKFDSVRFVDRAIASAQEAFATDPEKGLGVLREALQHRPGDERLLASERSLRQQAEALRLKHLLEECLRSAREHLAAQQFDQAIGVLEAFQLEHGSQPDVDHLLEFARVQREGLQRRSLVDRTASKAQSLIAAEKLDEAAAVLQDALQSAELRESGDTTLAGLLEDVRTRQAAAERKRDAVVKRAQGLRDRGDLEGAIAVLSEYFATGARHAAGEELLGELDAERTRRQVTQAAVDAAENAIQAKHFAAALEALQAVVLAYGESDELTRASERVKSARTVSAQEVVGKSIETSRAALLAGDVEGALAALRTANEMVEYADPARQADWRRIGQAAKKAQSEPKGTVIADPLANLPEAEGARKTSPALLGMGAVAALAVVGGVLFMTLRKPPQPAPSATEAQITIIKAPHGAMVSIDGGVPKAVDATGTFRATVRPGSHLLEVTKDGFDTYDERLQVAAGDRFQEPIALTAKPPVSNSGTIVMQSNVPGFKVTVDDKSRGEFLKTQGSLVLEAGQHTIQYSNEDGSDRSPKHTVMIAAGKSVTDSFLLKAPKPLAPTPSVASKPSQPAPTPAAPTPAPAPTVAAVPQPAAPAAPTTGTFLVKTSPGAQISLVGPDGSRTGDTADASGSKEFANLKPGNYKVAITKEGFQPLDDTASIVAGRQSGTFRLVAKEAPPQPAPVAAAPAAAAVDDHAADYKGIQAAVANYVAAYQSKNLGQLQAAWLNAGGQVKRLKGVFDAADFVKLSDQCSGQPVITGDKATQRCEETSQYFKNTPPQSNPFTYTFVKNGGRWVLKDRTSLR